MNPSPRLRRRDSHFTTTVGPTTLPATVLVNCGFVFGSQRAKYICGRNLTTTVPATAHPGLTPQLVRSSCVRCNPLELAHRISRERRERPQVRYLITRSFSEYSRRPGIKYPHVNPPHSHNRVASQSDSAMIAIPFAELGYKTWKSGRALESCIERYVDA